jgi:hypothetical protein
VPGNRAKARIHTLLTSSPVWPIGRAIGQGRILRPFRDEYFAELYRGSLPHIGQQQCMLAPERVLAAQKEITGTLDPTRRHEESLVSSPG